MMKNELIPVFDKIAKKMNLDFQNGFLDDVFETDYCITRVDLPECSDDEIETCKMDWIHSKKDDFIYSVICELYPNVYHSNENYYEKFYDECFQYLIDKTFKENNMKNYKINEFDTQQDRTKEFEECSNAMRNLSITNIIKAVDYINELSTFIPSNNEVLDYLKDVVEPLIDVINECRTDKECPNCGCYLFKSDLPQYHYVCAECDENFDEGEVK